MRQPSEPTNVVLSNVVQLGSWRAPRLHRLCEAAIRLAAGLAVAALLLILLFIGREAWPLLTGQGTAEGVSLATLLWPQPWPGYATATSVWQPIGFPPKFGILPLLVGTLKVTSLAMALSLPLGVLSAVYISQYAPRRLREWLKPSIELLAGVPSVVLGFFALTVISTTAQRWFGFTYRLNAFSAAIGLGLAITPVIFTVADDALRSVPNALCEAALAVGARPWQTIVRVIVPAATPGLVAAAILGMGRAIGETMIVLMASGNAAVSDFFSPTSSARTITATVASELGEVERGGAHWQVLFLLGTLLFLVTFVLQRLGIVVVLRLQRRLHKTG